MVLLGTIVKGAIVLDQSVPLVEGSRVEVEVKPIKGDSLTLSQRLLKRAGTVSGLPSDMAEQHDHYIHGTAKE